MPSTFLMKLKDIQPSQLYISKKKLVKIQQKLDVNNPDSLETIPVKKQGNDIVYSDGHTRAFAAYLLGWEDVRVEWETEDLDWEMYEICVDWCKKAGIFSIADLESRVITHEEYEILWYKRCKDMQDKLTKQRKNKKK